MPDSESDSGADRNPHGAPNHSVSDAIRDFFSDAGAYANGGAVSRAEFDADPIDFDAERDRAHAILYAIRDRAPGREQSRADRLAGLDRDLESVSREAVNWPWRDTGRDGE